MTLTRRDALRLMAGVPLVLGLGGRVRRADADDAISDAVDAAIAADRPLVFIVVPGAKRYDPLSGAIRIRVAKRLHVLLDAASESERRLLGQAVTIVASREELAADARLGPVVARLDARIDAAVERVAGDDPDRRRLARDLLVHSFGVFVAAGGRRRDGPLEQVETLDVGLDRATEARGRGPTRCEPADPEEHEEALLAPLAALLDALAARLPGEDAAELERRARRQLVALGAVERGRVEATILELAGSGWAVRERASRWLAARRDAIYWPLWHAWATTPDPEIRARCARILLPEADSAPVGTRWDRFRGSCARVDPYQETEGTVLCGMARVDGPGRRYLRITAGE